MFRIGSPILLPPRGNFIAWPLKQKLKQWVRQWWQISCPFCDRASRTPVCEDCWRRLILMPKSRCQRCGLPVGAEKTSNLICAPCLKTPPFFDTLSAPFIYQKPMAALIHAFKFHGAREQAHPLAYLWCRAERMLNTVYPICDCDFLTPTPLHVDRWRERGYNQSILWGQSLARLLGLPWFPQLLSRVRATDPQSQLKRRDRLRNLKGAFALSHGEWQELIQNKSICLIDDVVTTGETVNSISQLLKAQGARSVHVVALARTVRD